MKKSALILVLWMALPAWADSFEGVVTGVQEGDTLRVKDRAKREIPVRLLGIDAPNAGQRGYWNSKESLKKLCQGQKVLVEWYQKQVCAPRAGSCAQLAKVLLRGDDIALRQVQSGQAWQDPHQEKEQSTTDRTLYRDAQFQAKVRHRGLWADKNPTPPWKFRLR